MTDLSDLPERGEPHEPGASAYLFQEMQLYGHRPYEDEPDGRPLPDYRLAGGAVADIFDAMAGCLVDTRIEPDLEDLLWNIVNIFHRAGERIERDLDRNEQAQREQQPAHRRAFARGGVGLVVGAAVVGDGECGAHRDS